MFDKLRKMILPIILIVLFFFVAMIFLQWGLDFSGRNKSASTSDAAGTINGERVSWAQYQQTYNSMLDQESKGGQVEVSESRTRQLEQSAWQQIVHDKLVMQEAAKHNIVVTDQEIFAYLLLSPPQYMQSIPQFQTDGRFDYEKYKSMMADPKASPFWASIEPGVRVDLTRLKMQEQIIQTAQVTEPEVRDAFLADNEKIKVGFINVPYSKYMSRTAEPDDATMRKYYDEHKDQYKMDERAELKIAMVEKGATEADWQEAQARLQIIHDSIAAGADFATMAKTYSQDNSGSNGGDVGWFAEGAMVPEFSKVSFGLKEGELSEPFRSQFGWHIVKQLGFRNDPNAKAGATAARQAHVAHILLRALPSQASLDRMYKKMQEFKTAAAEQGFEKAAAADPSIKVQSSGIFTREMSLPVLGYDPIADSFAFANEVGTISEVGETNSAYYVAQVSRRLPAGIADFDEARPVISRDLHNQQVAKICHDTAMVVLAAARTGSDLQALATQHGLPYKETDYVNRNGYLPDVGRDPNAIGAAFALANVGQVGGPADYAQGSLVMKLLDRQAADMSVFNAKHDSLTSVVRSNKQQQLYTRWVQNLFKTSDISSNVGKSGEASGS